jgi:RNA polymerase sigma factor (sigma-70 family)
MALFLPLGRARIGNKLHRSHVFLGTRAWTREHPRLTDRQRAARFEEQILVHLDSAYNLAKWITRDAVTARDAVQDGCLRAFRAFDQMQGPNARAWFLAIIRHACIDLLREQRGHGVEEEYDEDLHGSGIAREGGGAITPEDIAVQASDARWLRGCIDALPRDYREVIVLRELEELSYKEISAIVDIPIGTVMSRLARGRALLQQRMVCSHKRYRR